MSPLPAALAVLLAASPASQAVRVRVLSRYHPTSARAKAESVRCDGRKLAGSEARIRVAGEKLALEGGPSCAVVALEAPEIAVAGVAGARAYRGTIAVRVRGAELELVNELGLEDYLASVVGGETVGKEREALKAQAVVSRTFAAASRNRHGDEGYDLCDLAHCQVYPGRSGESEAARAAVQATAGEVLRREGRLEPAWFHSSCGGATSAARDVFGEEAAGAGVDDRDEKGTPLCAASPDASWTFSFSRGELAKALGLPAQGRALEVARRDRAGRVIEVRAFGVRMSGAQLQSKVGRAVGWHKLKSLLADVEESNGEVRFRGRGLGHGVGLCQWGASALAGTGMGYREILARYFPGAVVGP